MASLEVVPGRPDAEVAADLKRRLPIAVQPLIDLMNEARMAGLILDFGIGRDEMGRAYLQSVRASKVL